jgi:integrase
LLTTTTLRICTINRRVKAINQLKTHVDLFDSEKVVKFLNESKWKNGTKNIVLQSYDDFQRMYGLTPVGIRKYHVVQQLPFVPLEQEIDALIAGCSQRLSCYLSLLKETGMRPIEAWSLDWTDIDTVQKTVKIRTAKHGVARILPISERMVNLIFAQKKRSKYVFAVSEDETRFNKELSHFTKS